MRAFFLLMLSIQFAVGAQERSKLEVAEQALKDAAADVAKAEASINNAEKGMAGASTPADKIAWRNALDRAKIFHAGALKEVTFRQKFLDEIKSDPTGWRTQPVSIGASAIESSTSFSKTTLKEEGERERSRVVELIHSGISEAARSGDASKVKTLREALKEINSTAEYLPTIQMTEGSRGVFRNPDFGTIAQAINERSAHVMVGGKRILIDGVNANKIVDEQVVKLPGIYEYVGTKRYDTIGGGSNQIHWVRRID